MKGRLIKGEPEPPEKGGSSGSASSGGKVIKKDVHDAREQKKKILGEAEEEATGIIDKAKADAEKIRSEARDEGYEEGIGKLNDLLLEFHRKRDRMIEDSRSDLLRLSVRIAEKVLGRELEENEDALADIVIKAIRGIRHEKRIQIRVHPDDLEKIRSKRQKLLDEVGAGKELEFQEDRSVSPGGCIVETDLGIIDARLDTQLRVLERALLARKSGA